MSIEDMLLQRYGPLLSLPQLATLLDRSADGLRVSLKAQSEWAASINSARLKIGGRVYFRTDKIAAALTDLSPCDQKV